ncbi:MAG: YihY/virulence factor BrkB family protein [Myxococcota bacterium]|nr:YihY/virulence factor BrkB family protein [Myxococcota bacterium]
MAASSHPRLREAWTVAKETISEWSDDNASRLAAGLSCYTLLSIAPLLVLSVAIAGLAVGEEAARGQIVNQIGAIVGNEAGGAIQSIAANAKEPSAGILSTILGLAVLLFGASGVFFELQNALNAIWEVEPKPNQGVRGFIRHRFFSFAMVMALAFLLLVSLIVNAGLAATGKFFEDYLPGGEALWQVVNFTVALAVTALLFALIFKIVPDVILRWKDALVGGLFTAVLFALGRFALAMYIGKSSTTSSFGVAGSLVALVLWVYYSSQILFLGAEFTQVYSRKYGGKVRPNEHAMPANDANDAKASKKGENAAEVGVGQAQKA